RDESGGLIASVTDTEILAAQIRLASSEGLFAEPASAAPLALLTRLVQDGKIDREATTVVVLTGSGLKDPDAALKNVETAVELGGDARTLAKVLKLKIRDENKSPRLHREHRAWFRLHGDGDRSLARGRGQRGGSTVVGLRGGRRRLPVRARE